MVRDAYAGRIECLFIAEDVQVWGHVRDDDNAVQIAEKPTVADEDLLNLVAILTHERGGRVHVMKSDRVPGATVIAALLRYQDAPQAISPVVEAV